MKVKRLYTYNIMNLFINFLKINKNANTTQLSIYYINNNFHC